MESMDQDNEKITQQPSSKKKGIRHAEKRRTSTCHFADRVARLSVDHYHGLIPEETRLPQTCLATIVAHNKNDGSLHVLSMGIGTKFLAESILKEEAKSSNYGTRIRDCHAEVLARRGFCRFLCLEILEKMSSKDYSSQILEKTEKNNFRLRPSITLHMYTSSAPCGNAALKKFSKMTRERFREDLGPNEWPTNPHEPIHGHSVKMGQFLLLIKKDNSVVPAQQETPETKRPKTHEGRKVWPANKSDDWTPPGTTTTTMNKGSIHTCSDKICRWNFLGLQGSLLSTYVEDPLYISTLTVGRKLTECICRRAVCCRMGEYNQTFPPNPSTQDANSADYRINHPAILGTAVYMDESGAVETDSEVRGQDVRFHSSLSWAWWRIPAIDSPAPPINNQLECIDGSTGYLTTSASERKGQMSKLSTKSFTELFSATRTTGQTTGKDVAYSTLESLCRLKRDVSPDHENTKDGLLSKHRVLRQWNRRITSVHTS